MRSTPCWPICEAYRAKRPPCRSGPRRRPCPSRPLRSMRRVLPARSAACSLPPPPPPSMPLSMRWRARRRRATVVPSRRWSANCCGRCSRPGSTRICRTWLSAWCVPKSNACRADAVEAKQRRRRDGLRPADVRRLAAVRGAASQFGREPAGQRRQRDGGRYEQRHRREAVEHERARGDPQRLAEIDRRREDRDRGAPRLWRHLRGIGLQRVVERIEAEPDGGDRDGRKPPSGAEGEREIGETQEHPAEDREPRLSEPVHQLLNRGGVKQAPDPERSDDQSDRAEGEPEAQMQIGADIGEGAPSDARLDEHGENDEARPRIGEHGDIVGNETARGLLAVAGRAGARVGQQLEHEPCGRQREQSREHEKDAAPAEQLAEHAARRLAEQLAENLPREIAREHRLAALVGRHVADISHGERNDPAGGRARREARDGERGERLHRAVQRHQDRGERAHHRDGAIFAEAVADRADDELDRAVAHGVGGDHDRGFAHRGAEIGGDLRQERVGHAHHRLARKACDREQDDGARRDFGAGRRRGHAGFRCCVRSGVGVDRAQRRGLFTAKSPDRDMIDKTYQPSAVEGRIYATWEEAGAFRAGRPERRDARPYCIVIPPPNVTGSLHMGHALNNTLQDVLVRFERMRGRDVLWQPGTDHAGIATQMVVERQLMERQEKPRRDLGREKFLEKVWAWKAESGGTITQQLKRLGASCDWSRERFTMDEGLSRAVLKVFVELYNAGLIYKDKRLVNWDPKLLTAISDLEVQQVEVRGSLWHLRYPIDGARFDPNDPSTFITVATTRPETMLGDVAVAVHPDDERYKHLVGKLAVLPLVGRRIPIIADEYSDPEKGTGAVKITPAHDFNDFEVGRRHDLPLVDVLDA